MTETTKPTPTGELSPEESAFFIKAIWEALIAPSWTRDDLIELGKVIFAKIPLGRLPDQQFAKLLPYLKTMASTVGKKILEQASAAPSPSPAQASETKPEVKDGQ